MLETRFETRLATLADVPALVELLNEGTRWLLGKGIGQWEYPCAEGPLIAQVESEQVCAAESQGMVARSRCERWDSSPRGYARDSPGLSRRIPLKEVR